MFRNLKAWLLGKRNGATSGADQFEKQMRDLLEPDADVTQPVVSQHGGPAMTLGEIVQSEGGLPQEQQIAVPVPASDAPIPEPPKPVQIVITFEGEGSAEFSFHRDARISPMMLCPVIDYMTAMKDLEYQTIVLDQKRKAAEQEQKRIKVARNPMPKFFRGAGRR